jgi:hypothetical protein
VPADRQRALAHAANSALGGRAGTLVDADPVVADRQLHLLTVPAQHHGDAGGVGMADRVGDALLGNAIQDELLVVVELRQVALQLADDANARAPHELGREVRQGSGQPQRVESLRPQRAHDSADVFDGGQDAVAHVDDLVAQIRRRALVQPVELQGERREVLADLVVQLVGDAAPLGFSLRERPVQALTALALETIEHLVEGLRQHADLRLGAGGGDPLPGPQRVHAAHEVRQPFQRRHGASHQDEVDDQHHRHPAPDGRNSSVGRLQVKDEPRGRQHRGVGDEQTPEERDVPRMHG